MLRVAPTPHPSAFTHSTEQHLSDLYDDQDFPQSLHKYIGMCITVISSLLFPHLPQFVKVPQFVEVRVFLEIFSTVHMWFLALTSPVFEHSEQLTETLQVAVLEVFPLALTVIVAGPGATAFTVPPLTVATLLLLLLQVFP